MSDVSKTYPTVMASAEIVFPLRVGSDNFLADQAESYSYANGQVKVPGPWKRGRPRGLTGKGGKDQHESPANVSSSPQLEFINISLQSPNIDENSRTRIRKHVKVKRRQYRANRHQAAASGPEIGNHTVVETERQSSGLISKPNLLQIPGVDPFDTAPIKLQPHMHDLLSIYTTTAWKHFYSLEKSAGFNPMTEYWLPLAFQDPAVLHSLIGCAEVYDSGYASFRDGLKGSWHLHAAISIVNRRLKTGKDIASSGTLTVTAGIAMLEKGAGRHDHWHIHMRGLKQLVDMGGGLESLYSRPLILNKIYRADLYGSLDAAQPPYFEFNRQCLLLPEIPPERSFRSEGFNALHKIVNMDETLRTCIHQLEEGILFWYDADRCSRAAGDDGNNGDATKKKKSSATEAARVRHLLTGVQYSLLSTKYQHRFSESHGKSYQILEFCRITLIIFSLTILNERPPSSAVGQQICGKFRDILTDIVCQPHRITVTSTWVLPFPREFCLWAMFLATGVIIQSEYDTKDWLVASFAALASPENGVIKDWDDLKAGLSRYLWVSSIHDCQLRTLLKEAAEARRKQVGI